jgi:hypothetical protein
MLQPIAPDIWHMQHPFIAGGLRITSRMTVVRLADGGLWLHSPVPMTTSTRARMQELGEVKFIVAPNKMHHLFVGEHVAAYPQAQLLGAPGLAAKRPDLSSLRELGASAEPAWQPDLEQVFFDGIPLGNETAWFHVPSRTLILTDLCQYWEGELPFAAALYAHATGVRKQLAVPRTIRLMVRDRKAAAESAARILRWPFERVIVAHNAIIEQNAREAVERAFAWFRG